MAELWQLAKLIRSKNAGPFILTFDIICKNLESFARIRKSGVLSGQTFCRLYGVPVEDVSYFEVPSILAFKVSIPRPTFSGDLADTDVYGGQFHSALVQLHVDNAPP